MTAKRFKLDDFDSEVEMWELMNIQAEIISDLEKENERLRTKNNVYIQDIEVFKEENTHLKLENEELRQRNDRQAKRLDNLYRLIEEKDWRTLSDIIDDFKRCEEQLQRESGTYW